jgi:hypothetical protein
MGRTFLFVGGGTRPVQKNKTNISKTCGDNTNKGKELIKNEYILMKK